MYQSFKVQSLNTKVVIEFNLVCLNYNFNIALGHEFLNVSLRVTEDPQ
jgi:hypothetical protein